MLRKDIVRKMKAIKEIVRNMNAGDGKLLRKMKARKGNGKEHEGWEKK